VAEWDLLIRGGDVIDGTRRPRYRADVAIQGDRIVSIGDHSADSARCVVDATGQVVAPGFIDVHNHTDGWLLRERNFAAKTCQGFTTELLMSDGISYAPVDQTTALEWFFYLRCLDGLRQDEYRGWESLADYRQLLHQTTAQNSVLQVPFANVRSLICGFGRAPADDLQLKQMQLEIRQGMEAGATGLSTGIDYIAQCFSSTDELVSAASAIAPYGGLYVTHVRYKRGLLAGVQEAVEIGRRAGCTVHISHMKPHTADDIDALLTYVDKVARHEVDFSFEVYPYQPGSTMLNYLLPYEVWEHGPIAALGRLTDPVIQARFRRALQCYRLPLDRIQIAWVASAENKRHQGRLLQEYVDSTGLPAEVALLRLLIEERMAVLLVFLDGDDRIVSPMLQHDLAMIGSDGIFFPDGQVHPRVYGTAPRVLGRCVREWRLFSLEDAVSKLSSVAARRFGLVDRGELQVGRFADVVVFDPARVDDPSTLHHPHQPAVGISTVVVNGTVVVDDGKPVTFSVAPSLPGRSLGFHDRGALPVTG
jgi:N-acyl-D-amino-acid deacylase